MVRQGTGCIEPDVILEYLEDQLSEEEEFEIENHIAECEECTRRVRLAFAFNSIWDRWTAKTHGEAHRRASLLMALDRAVKVEQGTSRAERLLRWRKRWGSRAEAAVQLVLNVPNEVTRIITEGMETLLKPQPRWQFEQVLQLREELRCRDARIRRAIDETRVIAKGTPGAEVSIDEKSGSVEVRLTGLADGQDVPLILLIPDTEGEAEAPLIAEPQREGEYYLARFESVPPGKYTLVFEPLS